MNKLTLAAFLFLTSVAHGAQDETAPPATAADYRRIIRANDLKALEKMSHSGVKNVKDRLDWTPLHYAALYGSPEAVSIILRAGGDPNARNKTQATPVMYAGYNFEKTKILLEHGGDVNAKSSNGSAALWVAAGLPGSQTTMEYMIAKGANVMQGGPAGSDYLIRNAGHGDATSVRMLLEKGLDPRHSANSGNTALSESFTCDAGAKARLLLQAGADTNASITNRGSVKNGLIAAKLTPLMNAAVCGEPDTIAAMLKAGANVNALDDRKTSALIVAIAADRQNPDSIRRLVDGGALLNVTDENGETAADWARRYGNTEALAIIEKAGGRGQGLKAPPVRPADYHPDAGTAVARASGLLAKSDEEYFRASGCVGCHHQAFSARAFAAARAAGLQPDPQLRQSLLNGMLAERPRELDRLPLMQGGGGEYEGFLYSMAALAEMGEPASEDTDLIVHYIAGNQDISGAWSRPAARPPIQSSDVTRTMLAILALKSFGWPAREQEFNERIARARNWLLTAPTRTTLDLGDKLMGLWLAGAGKADLKLAADALIREQRSDGGWAQTSRLESDAFGTSSALYSLVKSGAVRVTDEPYRKGAAYLLNTQFPDGSWYVRSRALRLQPYFSSGFPYERDQWISAAATAYAVMALSPAVKSK